jgi:hypothetical protein
LFEQYTADRDRGIGKAITNMVEYWRKSIVVKGGIG